MAMVQQLITTNAVVIEDGGSGRVLVEFESGGLEFSDVGEFQAWIAEKTSDPVVAKALLLGHLLAKDPLLNSLPDWNGKKVTLDPEQALPVNVFKVV